MSFKMFKFGIALVIFGVVGMIRADESSPNPVVPIVSLVNAINADGNYTYSYESGDGTQQQQQGYLKVYDANHTEEVAQGSYSYKGDDGQVVSLSYVADANGYQPQGDSIPVGPPVPPLIAKALAYLATQPPSEEDQA